MRYIVRRKNPTDFSDLKKEVSDLETQLGKAGDNSRRVIKVRVNAERYFTYPFFTRKNATDFEWICSSVEVVAENETGLFAMTDKLGVERPSHLVFT